MGEELEVDARGLLCPLPVMRLARALRRAPSGAVALLLATDPAAERDVEAFCRDGTHALLEVRRNGELLALRVRKEK